jgi:hypothetical protein
MVSLARAVADGLLEARSCLRLKRNRLLTGASSSGRRSTVSAAMRRLVAKVIGSAGNQPAAVIARATSASLPTTA